MLIPRLLLPLSLFASAVLADGTGDTAAAAASGSSGSSGSNSGCLMYTIQGNDTGYDIAKMFGLEFSVMNASNPNIAWDKIKIGENVLIPSGYTTQPATGVTPAPSCPPAAPAAPVAESGTDAAPAEPRDASGSAASAPPASSSAAGSGTAAGAGSGGAAPSAGSASSSAAAPAGSSASASGTGAPAASGSASAAPVTSGCKAYVVVSGDTGETIAQKNGATMAELNAQNPSIVWEKLEVDQILVLPPTATGTGLLDRPDCKPAGIVPPAPPAAASGAGSGTASGAAGGSADGPGTAAAPPASSAAGSAGGAAGSSATTAVGGAAPTGSAASAGAGGSSGGAPPPAGGAPPPAGGAPPPAGSSGAAGGGGAASSAPAAPSAAGSSGGTAASATTGAPSSGSAKSVTGTGGGGGAEPVSVIKYISPASSDCASAKYKDECATAADAAPHVVDSFTTYKVTTPGEQAALLSWMLFESEGFQYNRNHFPGNPGQGTRCMFMPEFVKEYAATFPALKTAGLSDDDVLKLVMPNEYSFGSAAWFYSAKCDDKTKAGLKEGTTAGWKAWITDCVKTTVDDKRQALYDKAREALGVNIA